MIARNRKGVGTKDDKKASKICVTCGRPFTWRKKWERCWDEVQTCSARCNGERRRNNRSTLGSDDGEDGSEGETVEQMAAAVVKSFDEEGDTRRQEKKAAKKATKAAQRAKREGEAPHGTGQKVCQREGCGRSVDLLVRCQTDESNGQWLLVCGKCWRFVSGGVADGDAQHPGYRYGGLWKNRHVVAPPSAVVVETPPMLLTADHCDDEDDQALAACLSTIGTRMGDLTI